MQLLYEKPTSVNQAGLCQAKLEHNCWSLIFFFQCPGSVFLALSFTFRITVHFFSTFCRLENGDMANARVLFPHRAHTLAVHMHTHTFPQSTACIGDLCIEACFPCFYISASSSVFPFPNASRSHFSFYSLSIINFSPLLAATLLFTGKVLSQSRSEWD